MVYKNVLFVAVITPSTLPTRGDCFNFIPKSKSLS